MNIPYGKGRGARNDGDTNQLELLIMPYFLTEGEKLLDAQALQKLFDLAINREWYEKATAYQSRIQALRSQKQSVRTHDGAHAELTDENPSPHYYVLLPAERKTRRVGTLETYLQSAIQAEAYERAAALKKRIEEIRAERRTKKRRGNNRVGGGR